MKNINKNTNQFPFGYIDLTKALLPNRKKSDVSPRIFDGASEVIRKFNPYIPAYLYRSKEVRDASRWFVENFVDFESVVNGSRYQSRVLYSVKSNSDNRVLQDIFASGVTNFDVASIKEARQIASLFGKKVKSYFMHPIKAEEVISEAYFKHNIRDFSFDSREELEKILRVTKNANDLSLHLRIKMNCESSAVDLSSKFGIDLQECSDLAIRARNASKSFGVCFHVGSQCMDPKQYANAIERVARFFADLRVRLDSFDVGGGFPSSYVGLRASSMSKYLEQIRGAIAVADLPEVCEILCEPGRALVAQCESLLVRVEAKKGDMLYINDGSYGGLFDAGVLGFRYHCTAFDKNGKKIESENKRGFGFYGPTCDSLDKMAGPFMLPSEIKAGDFIEIYNLGAYSKNLRTSFNGCDDVLQLDVRDDVDQAYRQEF